MPFKHEIVIAGLLHDIGKFFNDCGGRVVAGFDSYEGTSATHPITSYKFVEAYESEFIRLGLDSKAIKEMVLWHHGDSGDVKTVKEYLGNMSKTGKYSGIRECVHKADGISSNERLTKGSRKKDFAYLINLNKRSEFLMSSAFNRYKFDGNYTVTNAGLMSTSTSNKPDIELNTKTVEKFVKDFNTMIKSVMDANELLVKMNEVLEKYTSFTCSASNELLNDVSLYHHLKSTAAIASVYSDGLKPYRVFRIYIRNPERYFSQTKLLDFDGKMEYAVSTIKQLADKICELSDATFINCIVDTPLDKVVLVRDGEQYRDVIHEFIRRTWEETDGYMDLVVKKDFLLGSDITSTEIDWLTKLNDDSVEPDYSINKILTSTGVWNDIKITRDRQNLAEIEAGKLKFDAKYYAMAVFDTCDSEDDIIEAVLHSKLVKTEKGKTTVTDMDYTSISRYSTVVNSLYEALNWSGDDFGFECKTYRVGNQLVVVSKFSDILGIVEDVYGRFSTITCGKLSLNAKVRVFNHSVDIGRIYKDIVGTDKSYDGFLFNSVEYDWEEMDCLIDLMGAIEADMTPESDDEKPELNSSLAYRYIDTINGAIDYMKTGDATKLIEIPRLNKHRTRKGSNSTDLSKRVFEELYYICEHREVHNKVILNAPELIKYLIEEVEE